MDYLRIYNELIEHRKMMPKLEGVYYERHHIVARCMGGGDEPENLVYLTVEDHFMAHLLLAKAYDTDELWYAAKAMLIPRDGRTVVKNRKMYARVKEEAVRRFLAKRKDFKKYEFRDLRTGEVLVGTRDDAKKKFGLTRNDVARLVLGQITTSKGVCMAVSNMAVPNVLDSTLHMFKHIVSGETYQMTRKEFSVFADIPITYVNRIVDGEVKFTQGYCMASTDDWNHRPAILREFRRISTGEVLHKTSRQLIEEYSLPAGSVFAVLKGKMVKCGDFCLNSTLEDDPRLKKERKKPLKNGFYTLHNIPTGDVVRGSAEDIAAILNCTKTQVYRFARGAMKEVNGYTLLSAEEASPNREAHHLTEH
jgi:hypothetical protein